MVEGLQYHMMTLSQSEFRPFHRPQGIIVILNDDWAMWTYCGNRNLIIMIFLLQRWDIMFTIFILTWVILYIINMDLPNTNCHRWTWCLQMSWQYHSSGHQWPSHRIVKTNVIGYDIREHMKPVVQSDSQVCNALGVVLIWRSHLTSIKILIIKIRQSHDCLIHLMEICTHKNDCILKWGQGFFML